MLKRMDCGHISPTGRPCEATKGHLGHHEAMNGIAVEVWNESGTIIPTVAPSRETANMPTTPQIYQISIVDKNSDEIFDEMRIKAVNVSAAKAPDDRYVITADNVEIWFDSGYKIADVQILENTIKVGDTVWTTKQMALVDGYDPETGKEIQTHLGKRQELTVTSLRQAIGEDLGFECKTPAGTIVYLDFLDIVGV